MHIIVDDEKTEFHPGKIVYHVTISIPKQEDISVAVIQDLDQNKFLIKDKLNPILIKMIIFELKNYLASGYVQSDY